MKKLLFILSSVFLLVPCSWADSDDIFEEIAGGSDEFEFVRYSPEVVQMKIREDMEVACKDGLCTLFAYQQEKGGQWITSFNVGYGYNGDYETDDDVDTGGFGPYVGVTVKYQSKTTCTEKINVPRSLYIAMNTYMFDLINEDGTTKRTLTAAAEAMMMFYSTIIKQTKGCN